MEKSYFRVNKKEYCHINDEYIYIVNTSGPSRIPLAHDLGEGWGIASVFNMIIFALLLAYVALSCSYYGFSFFQQPLNYGAIILLILFLVRIKEGFLSSRTPTIERKKIRNIILKAPRFSFPRLVIYFDGPEGKVLRRTIPILYKQEAIAVLKDKGLIS